MGIVLFSLGLNLICLCLGNWLKVIQDTVSRVLLCIYSWNIHLLLYYRIYITVIVTEMV